MRRGLPLEKDPEKNPYSLYEGVEYQQFWTGLQKHHLDELEHIIVRNLLPISGCRIIDVGCGYGRLADCYMDRFQQVIMVDGSMSLLHQAIEKTRGQAIYIASDVTHLPFRTSSFDAMLMIRVFHHIEDSRACLSELHRILCSDGHFVFSYLNKQNALRVIQWLIGTNRENPFATEPVGLGSTIISHHPTAIHEMLCEAGFSNMQYYGAGVLDQLASRIGFTDQWVVLGEYLAPLLGKGRIAPWILCDTFARGNTDLIESKGISDLLQCPSCGGNIFDEEDEYLCLVCNKRYPVVDGIIDLRMR